MDTSNNTNKKKLDTKWIIAAIVVPLVVAMIGVLAVIFNKPPVINIEITPEVYEADLLRQKERIRKELSETIQSEEQEKHKELEVELKAVGEKLINLQQSVEEEVKRRIDAVYALEEFRGELPETKIEKAKKHLQGGDTETAEKLFDEVVRKGLDFATRAAYQSGQLAEGRIDYVKAMRGYRIAVTNESNNPDYLLAAGRMARTLGDYKEAQP